MSYHVLFKKENDFKYNSKYLQPCFLFDNAFEGFSPSPAMSKNNYDHSHILRTTQSTC